MVSVTEQPSSHTSTGQCSVDSPVLTVIVPVYNEVNSLATILDRVHHAPCDKQIIVVDDGSTDGTTELLKQLAECSPIEALFHERNRGKGRAIRTALEFAKGRYTIIQDGDLEYDPNDYPRLLEPLLAGEADVVYGSRYINRESHFKGRRCFDAGVKLLNFVVWLLYGKRITDEATCYKIFSTDTLRAMDLQCDRFEFCPEVTAKVIRLGLKLVDLPIAYAPRGVSAGKKIRVRDGIAAVRALWRHREWGMSDRSRDKG
jgi:glycosyltransferase involved in cell wall biosynthesis